MIRIGYAPYSTDFTAPGDRWRFAAYAKDRGLRFELADPARRYDLVVVTTAADIVTWCRDRPPGDRLVFDIVDSYLAEPRGPKDVLRGVGKYLLGDLRRPVLSFRSALERICASADAVVCATAEQEAIIRPRCANVHVILDVQDSAVREVKRDYRIGDTVNLFWEGLPYNLSAFAGLRGVLEALARERPVAVHLMTSLSFGRLSGRVGRVDTSALAAKLIPRAYVYEWNEEMLSRVATGCDLALIPLDLADAFARGKPENKLLLMWRMGMPTLVSRTPAYDRAMRAAGVAMTCETEAEWLRRLRETLGDERARREAGERGREFAVGVHSAERSYARWDQVLGSIGLR